MTCFKKGPSLGGFWQNFIHQGHLKQDFRYQATCIGQIPRIYEVLDFKWCCLNFAATLSLINSHIIPIPNSVWLAWPTMVCWTNRSTFLNINESVCKIINYPFIREIGYCTSWSGWEKSVTFNWIIWFHSSQCKAVADLFIFRTYCLLQIRQTDICKCQWNASF